MDPSIPNLLNDGFYQEAPLDHQLVYRYFNAAWKCDTNVPSQHEIAYRVIVNRHVNDCNQYNKIPMLSPRNTNVPVWHPPEAGSNAEKALRVRKQTHLIRISGQMLVLRFIVDEALALVPSESASDDELRSWLQPIADCVNQYFVNPDTVTEQPLSPTAQSLKFAAQILAYLVRCQSNCFLEDLDRLYVYLEQIELVLKLAETSAKHFRTQNRTSVSVVIDALNTMLRISEIAIYPGEQQSTEDRQRMCNIATKYDEIRSMRDTIAELFT